MRFVKITIFLISISLSLISGALAQVNQQVYQPAIPNPAIRNPAVIPGNVPVTSYRSGLVRSPNPIDNTAELIITGNVGGGKHFRGVLPYSADSDFGITSPSSNINSFLRYTAISENDYRGGITPFYSYNTTVTRFNPRTNEIIVPTSPKIRGLGLDSGLELQTVGYRQDYKIDTRTESVRIGPGLMPPEELLKDETDYLEKPLLPSKDYQKNFEEFNRELDQVSEKADNLQQQLRVESQTSESVKLTGLASQQKPEQDSYKEHSLDEQLEQQNILTQDDKTQQLSSSPKKDIYGKMMQEYKELNKSYEQVFGRTIEERAQEDAEPKQQSQSVEERKLSYTKSRRITDKSSPAQSSSEQSGIQGKMLEAETRKVVGEHNTFASFSEDRFNQSLRAAETYMKEGKFYLASDAYTMASMYKPEDPLSYAGKSHALFAAGEYVSSALYLAKAIEMFPGYVDFKIDIVSMIGDIDTVEKRINDINQWLQSSGAPELNFLLAYVYMQLDRLPKAEEAVNTACEKMPDLPVVTILQQAIQKRLGK